MGATSNDPTKPTRPDCGHSVCLWPDDPCGWCERDRADAATIDARGAHMALLNADEKIGKLEAALRRSHSEFCCSPEVDPVYGLIGACEELRALISPAEVAAR